MRFIYICACISLLLSCQGGNELAQRQFEDSCWSIVDTIEFSIETTAANSITPFHVEVAFEEEYAFRNIYYKWQLTSPNGQQTDVLSQHIMVDPEGYWMQEPSWGSYLYTFEDSINMVEVGTYQVKLFHYMREENLCEVEKLRITTN